MAWKTTLRAGDQLIIGGGTVITVKSKVMVVVEAVEGTTPQRIEKVEHGKPDPVKLNGGGPEFWNKL